MTFNLIYRLSMVATLTLATVVFTVDSAATVGLPSSAYAILVAACGCVALATVDRDRGPKMSRAVADYVLGPLAIVASLVEYRVDPDQLIHVLGHLLVALGLIKLFLPEKSERDDWASLLIGLVLVLIGGWVSPSDVLGVYLFAWGISALWALGLFHLQREARRALAATGNTPGSLASMPTDPGDAYPGLIDRSFVVSALRVALMTIALGGLIFLVTPRWGRGATRGQVSGSAQHLTGFSDTVRLGQIGEMLESDAVVMSVELYDDQNRRVRPIDEPLWRGISLNQYDGRRWSRTAVTRTTSVAFDPATPAGQRLRQVIKLEANLGDVLFALRPMVAVRGGDLQMDMADGSLYRPEVRYDRIGEVRIPTPPRTYEYEVQSIVNGSQIQPGEFYQAGSGMETTLTEVPLSIVTDLQAIVDPIIASIPEEGRSRKAIARAVEGYLRDVGPFKYSLRMTRTNPDIDPVVDFLRNHRTGHCEYFASSLALLLRSRGIPTRIVNGFKGGDWNDLGGVFTVRQKHTHSWVEALLSHDVNGLPEWLTLDPTPGGDRTLSVESVGGGSGRFRTLSDYIRYLWTFYVVGYSSDRQQRLVYTPAVELFQVAMRGFRVMGGGIASLVAWVFTFRDFRSLFSVRGFFASTLAMAAIVALVRLATIGWRRLQSWLGPEGDGDSAEESAVAFYGRLTRLLAAVGLERSGPETPGEFARRASVFLAARGEEADRIAEIPAIVVESFYRVRFGRVPIDDEDARRLDQRLDELATHLKP